MRGRPAWRDWRRGRSHSILEGRTRSVVVEYPGGFGIGEMILVFVVVGLLFSIGRRGLSSPA